MAKVQLIFLITQCPLTIKSKKIAPNTINRFYSVNVDESVNLDDGDSAIVESPFLFYTSMHHVILKNNLWYKN